MSATVQRSLFPAVELIRARKRDPSTSKAAAAMVEEFSDSHYCAILGALALGPGTIYEIAGRAKLDHVAVARRLSELGTCGLAKVVRRPDGGALTRIGATGRPCRVWAKA
jgi:predicted ArsR family transcriptional regulator